MSSGEVRRRLKRARCIAPRASLSYRRTLELLADHEWCGCNPARAALDPHGRDPAHRTRAARRRRPRADRARSIAGRPASIDRSSSAIRGAVRSEQGDDRVIRSPENYETGMSAFAAAMGGSLCVRSLRVLKISAASSLNSIRSSRSTPRMRSQSSAHRLPTGRSRLGAALPGSSR